VGEWLALALVTSLPFALWLSRVNGKKAKEACTAASDRLPCFPAENFTALQIWWTCRFRYRTDMHRVICATWCR